MHPAKIYPSQPALPPGQLTLKPVDANVHSVHLANGLHVGNAQARGRGLEFQSGGL